MRATATVEGLNLKRVFPESLLNEADDYVVVGVAKDGDGMRIAYRGCWDDADAYMLRNESPDNYERYYLAEVIT